MLMKDIVILGGGASGLMAAASAARLVSGDRILLLEQGGRVGKKLLATGNGRCNLTNSRLAPKRYHGAAAGFVSTVLSGFNQKDALAFFTSLGLICREEEEGRVYPNSGQAASVLEALRRALTAAGVEEACGRRVTAIQKQPDGYVLTDESGMVHAKKLILAAGGLAMPSTGSDGSGLKLAQSLGLTAAKTFPALSPIRVTAPFLKSVKGMRCRGSAAFLADGVLVREEPGEIQFTEQGLSGVCVFQLSRLAGEFAAMGTVNGKKARRVAVSLDLMPGWEEAHIFKFLSDLQKSDPGRPMESFLSGLINKRVGAALMKEAGIVPNARPCGELTAKELKALCRYLKHWEMAPSGVLPYQNAQVTAGGLRASQFQAETLEAKSLPGLYACGELLDVDGDCGGFNLQWAWSSGHLAGKSAAQALLREDRL